MVRKSEEDIVYVVYDDECPFCRSYCTLVRIKDTVGKLELVDARVPSPIMDEINALELDIDQGMVVKMNGKIYYGADAIHILSLLSSRSGFFNKMNYWIFKSERASSILYPILRDIRNIALKILGIPFIKNLEKAAE